MKTLPISLSAGLLILVAGCQSSRTLSPAQQIEQLNQENTQIHQDLDQSRRRVAELKGQINTLHNLDPNLEVERLYVPTKIKISRWTNLYDKNHDGKKETLIVYIQPIDEDGHVIKAAGIVTVQLWDLDKDNAQALLGQWTVKPDELKKLWFATILTINYRLSFDVGIPADQLKKPLTVKVTFTDYLTGRVFNEQRTIRP